MKMNSSEEKEIFFLEEEFIAQFCDPKARKRKNFVVQENILKSNFSVPISSDDVKKHSALSFNERRRKLLLASVHKHILETDS
jgi:hypothetical protein